MTDEEKQEVHHLLEAHERTVAICRSVANTARELALEVKRGRLASGYELEKTIEEAERVLDDLGKMEIALGKLKAALW